MKKMYTALVALGLALGANAQTSYKLDSTFNGTGSKIFTTDFPDATIRGCYLNNDGTMVVAAQSGSSINNTRYAAKINANGSINPSLCSSMCVDTVGASFYTNVYKLNNDYYLSSTGYGGDAILGNATSLDAQVYDKNTKITNANVQFNSNHIIEATSGQATIYAYNANTVGVGYQGAAGIINGATYAHGGSIPAISGTALNGIALNALGVQANKSIIAAGGMYVLSSSQTEPFIIRYKPNSLIVDSTFGTNGIVKLSSLTGEVTALEIAANDDIYVCYTAGSNAYFGIYNANGSIKSTANNGGTIAIGNPVYNFIITKQNKVILAKYGSNAKLVSVDMNGYDDNTFNNGSNEMLFANLVPNSTYFNINDIASDAYGNLAISGYANTATNSNWLGTIVRLKSLSPVAPSAIKDIRLNAMELYPNPASNQITIENIILNDNVSITNITGKAMKVNQINEKCLNIEDYPSGIYYIQINDGQQILSSKFIKQ